MQIYQVCLEHRRWVNTEEKANVVAAVWGEQNLFNSLPHQLFCLLDDLKNRMYLSFSFRSSWCNSSYSSNRPLQQNQHGKELNKFCPPKRSDDICLFFCLYPSSMVSSPSLPFAANSITIPVLIQSQYIFICNLLQYITNTYKSDNKIS